MCWDWRSMTENTRPFWAAINDEALRDAASLARVLSDMGFNVTAGALYCGAVTRGAIRWWQPDYIRPAIATQGTTEQQASFAAHRRATVAPTNRAMRDAMVHILAAPVTPGFRIAADGRRYLHTHYLYIVDTYSGEWRSVDGAQLGNNLLSLGALRWDCTYGQAGARIARIIDIRMPTIPAPERKHARAG